MISAIILAGGKGKRMRSAISKQFIDIKGKPIIYYTLKKFSENKKIDNIIVVLPEDEVKYFKENILKKYELRINKIVIGGKERQDSVYNALKSLKNSSTDIVLIHDGARPFITEEIIERGLEKVKETGACVVGMPSKDTIKLSDAEGYVKETPDRKCVWTIQTPQIFSYALIREAHDSIRKKDMSKITDDAMVIEQETGVKVALAEGSYQNIKITTPEDLYIAEAFLR